ncbi:hypothetical protein [Mycolicibacterium sediminis]|uniref:LysA protein n=1 Tax=Mycolicibacterium sediminis TaxID=1286180 RepID=A0A7I7QXN6_9MYCO|nr:hypothetical protein [Mycolicibacterium sediminis]BBY31143.1 hypothetical protein MSEDJ_52390 [Mycolicibacterium sediminis]
MHTALVTNDSPPLLDSIRVVRGVITGAGCGVPAAALVDAAVTRWVREHGLTVTVDADDHLARVLSRGIRPNQLVFRCGPVTDSIRRAVNLGLTRFVVDTSQHIASLSRCAQRTRYLYLDARSPLVLGDRRLRVIGLHADVDASQGAVEWSAEAERLLCRAALLKTCGSPVRRIVLRGGSSEPWLTGGAEQLTVIAAAVDDALREGCERWQVSRPAVTLVAA